LFSQEMGLTLLDPKEGLKKLAQTQAELTKTKLNWAGTYNNAARHLLRRWHMEQKWNLSHP
jgi:hypothetical protein